jgi:hypothetical protein
MPSFREYFQRSPFSGVGALALCLRAKPSEMPTPTPQDLKKALTQAGFSVFRTQGSEIIVAERVRENLIMDSGVRLRAGSPLAVRVVFRAQRGDFMGEDDAHIFERVSRLAEPARAGGFTEVERNVAPVVDPGDSGRTLDTFYEITLAKDAADLDKAMDEVRFALGLDKMASRKHSVRP